jgi:hypothetical protein
MTRALIVIAAITMWFASEVLAEYRPVWAQQPPQMPAPGAPDGMVPPPVGGQPPPPSIPPYGMVPPPVGGQPPPPSIPPQPPQDVPDPDFCRQLRATFQDYDQDRQEYFAPYLKRCDEAGR